MFGRKKKFDESEDMELLSGEAGSTEPSERSLLDEWEDDQEAQEEEERKAEEEGEGGKAEKGEASAYACAEEKAQETYHYRRNRCRPAGCHGASEPVCA